jgi:cytochrome P450
MSEEVKDISFVDPETQLCPFPAYKRLHALSPVHRDPKTGFFEVTTYDDLFKVAQDHKTYSSEHPVYGDRSLTPAKAEADRLYGEYGYMPVPTLINADEPAHAKYRNLVDKSFRPARVKNIEPYIQELVEKLTGEMSAKGSADFVAAFAIPLPLYVIADSLGVSRDNAANFKRWSDALMKVHEPGISGELQIALTREVIEMQQFFAAELERARANPQENILGDLASAELEGRRLDVAEAVALLQSILVAGNETTTNALASGMLRLIQNPDIEARLRADPSLVPAFGEEVLRLDSPLQCQYRRPVQDVELSGTKIPADSMLVLRFGAGNRDEKRFEHADEIDLDRPRVRQHLAFGAGIHSCLGSILARAELRIAFQTLLARLRNFRLVGEPTYSPSYMAYGPRSLPIAFDRV